MKKIKTAKQVTGFDNEVIYVVKGDSFDLKEELKELGARFNRAFGWYFGSFAQKPDSLPGELSLVEVRWEEVGNPDGEFKNSDIIKEVLDSKIYEADPSEYVGSVGDRIEEFVLVEEKREFEGAYGTQNCYTFRDERDNCYVWFTATSTKTQFEKGETVRIRGTVKSHSSFRNIKQTTLSRVSKVKEK